jgi:hypothetical protein
MIRILALLTTLFVLAGCAERTLEGPPVPLGDFKLGHNVVVASKMQKVPISRDATEEEWTNALTKAIDDRFGRYDGEQLYHFGISVEGYALAPPGVPLVFTPKSALVVNVTLWDDATGRKLNEVAYQVAVLETGGTDSAVIGSGWGRDKEKQMQGLSFNAARAIENWMQKKSVEYGWFTADERVAPAGGEKLESSGSDRT